MRRLLVATVSVVLGFGLSVGAAPAGSAATSSADQITVGETGFSTRGPAALEHLWQATIATVVTNPTKKVAAITGKWTLKDAQGTVIDTSLTALPYVLPGETRYLAAERSTKVQVASVTFTLDRSFFVSMKDWQKGAGAPPSVRSKNLGVTATKLVKLSDLRYHSEGTGRAGSIMGTITSHAKVPFDDLNIDCAMFKGGKVIGGSWYYYHGAVPTKQAVGFQAFVPVDGLTPDEVRCAAGLNTGSQVIVGDKSKLVVSETGLVAGDSTFLTTQYFGLAATVHNGTKQAATSVYAEVDLLDASNRIIGHHEISSGYVLAGEDTYAGEQEIPAYTLEGSPKSVRMTVSADFVTPDEFQEDQHISLDQSEFTFANLSYDQSVSYGSIHGTVTAPNAPVALSARVDCAVFKNGKLTGAGFDYVTIPAGGSGTFDFITIHGAGPGDIRCYGNGQGPAKTATTTPST